MLSGTEAGSWGYPNQSRAMPLPELSKLSCSLGSWFPSAAGVAPETTAPKAHAPGELSRAPLGSFAHPCALCGQDLQSQLPRLDIWDLVTLFITVECFLAFLPCLRFPLSFGSMLACRLSEGAT